MQAKTYEYKDVINRGTERVYGFLSQQIAEIIQEAVSTQKGILYDMYSNFQLHSRIYGPILWTGAFFWSIDSA